MAQRRMFSPKIVSSDAFLDMPGSSQALYFHLGMHADDDGFVNPRYVMRMAGSSEDDLRILIARRFILPFENGVIVIKHWRINNLIKNDRYTPTIYEEQKALLSVKNNGAYTERNPNGTRLEPQVRLGKDSKAVRKANTPPYSEVTVVKLTTEGEEKQEKKKNPQVRALMKRAVALMKDQMGSEPLTSWKDYKGAERALKALNEEQAIEMVQLAIEDGTAEKFGQSLAVIFSTPAINKYKLQDS